MSKDGKDYFDSPTEFVERSELDDAESRIERLEERVGELEETHESSKTNGAVGGYFLGMGIAVVLSWSRNASILWCGLHGILSWLYVFYFAFTR